MWAGDPRETPMALRKPKYRYRNLPVSRAARLPVSRAALAVIMLPVEILRIILNYLDTKLLTRKVFGLWPPHFFGHWAGTRRMRHSLQIRRRLGQTEWSAYDDDIVYYSGPGPELLGDQAWQY